MRVHAVTFCLAIVLSTPLIANAEIQKKSILYQDGDVTLEGLMAWDDAKVSAGGPQKLPGVLVVHQWLGLTDHEKSRAEELASLGYVAFALDIYGKSDRPKNTEEAGKFAGKYKKDRTLYRKRLQLGLDQLKQSPMVDGTKLAAIGYCFGGTGVIELARSGADIDGVVSFHGGLDSPNPEDGKKIRAKVLILHGADDPFVPVKDIEAMKKEFNDAKVDWEMTSYSGTVHSFTHKDAGTDNARGAAYNPRADKRSWESMQFFFRELFSSK